jgi:hypothetical protein
VLWVLWLGVITLRDRVVHRLLRDPERRQDLPAARAEHVIETSLGACACQRV